MSEYELHCAIAEIDEKWIDDASLPVNRSKYRMLRIVFVAALTAILLEISSFAASTVFRSDFPGGHAEYFDDRVRVSYYSSDIRAREPDNSAIEKLLAEKGYKNVLLPSCLKNESCKITDSSFEKSEYVSSAELCCCWDGHSGRLNIMKYTGIPFPETDFPGAEKYAEISSDDITVLVFIQNDAPVLIWSAENCIVHFYPDCETDNAVAIAKTVS